MRSGEGEGSEALGVGLTRFRDLEGRLQFGEGVGEFVGIAGEF